MKLISSLEGRPFFASICFTILLVGCTGAEKRIEAPKMDPVAMAAKCMELADKNSDGELTSTELSKLPGLKSALKDIDAVPDGNGDGKLSSEELQNRFQLYVDSKLGIKPFACNVYMGSNSNPLPEGTIRLVPEPFMEEFIEPAEGQITQGIAQASIDTSKTAGIPGVRAGMYRIEISSTGTKIPKKYNEETILGMEVAPVTTQANSSGPLEIVLK